MRRRVQLDNLRGTDPVTLEVLVADALRRPIGQLAPVTLCDLMALSEVEGLPTKLSRGLAAFATRMAQEIADIPDGEAWTAFVAEMGEVDAGRVPMVLRDAVAAAGDADERASATRRAAEALAEDWGPVEPEGFDVGTGKARIERAATARPTEKAERQSSGRSSGGSRTGSTTRRTSTPKVVTEADRERQDLLSQLCLERLAGYGEQGLSETVLIAGVVHRARPDHPRVAGNDVTEALKSLEAQGHVRRTAGRWRLTKPWATGMQR